MGFEMGSETLPKMPTSLDLLMYLGKTSDSDAKSQTGDIVDRHIPQSSVTPMLDRKFTDERRTC